MSRISGTISSFLYATTALSGLALSQAALAQEALPQAAAEESATAEEIVVTGTRTGGRIVADSATPIQLLGSEAIAKVGQPNLNQALTQLVPSFTAQTQGTDMASFSLSARLRGVSPNHTLVMVNGKRRHGNSILQVIAGAFGGSAAPSIDLIPPEAVSRIEILQDGAAATYGTDAIAGVINIITKNNSSGFTFKTTAGEYYDGEGRTYSAGGNLGIPIGEGGFLNITLQHRRNDYTTIGDGQTSVRNIDGSTVRLTGANVRFQPLYDALNARNGTAAINGGQPNSQLNVAFYNFGYDFGDFEIYSFGDVSYRHGKALQGYRAPNRICVAGTAAAPTDPASCFGPTQGVGMVPLIEVKQNEFQWTGGIKGETAGWAWDVGGSYSEDKADVFTTRSANASLFDLTSRAAALTPSTADAGFTPRFFDDGGFQFNQLIGTIDVNKEFEVGMAEPMTFAFGGEYRHESFAIFAGDEGSRFIEGGQSFPGYGLTDAAKTKRTVKAVYGNFILKPTEDWVVDVAGRYEHYSDFGGTAIGKLTTRYDFSPAFALRATASTGFRAPTLQESGYSATNVGPTSATVQLAPSSPGSTRAGFGALKPEKSTNFSAGTVYRPIPKLVMSIDGYYIKIKNRIVSSGAITGQRQSPTAGAAGVPVLTPLINGLTPAALVTGAIAASGKAIDPTVLFGGTLAIQTFTNGIDTETKGIEFSAKYALEFDIGKVDLTLGANYNDTKVTKNKLGTLFNAQARAIIETSSQKFKAVAGALFTSGPFSANLRATYYSKAVVLVSPAITVATAPIPGNFFKGVVKPATIFDLELDYDVTEWANLAIGSNNLFNKKPQIPALVPLATLPTNGVSPYINGTTTINAPFNHGAYGTNGGYYYARLTFKF
jgi:iron complex outermembrane receptor protein